LLIAISRRAPAQAKGESDSEGEEAGTNDQMFFHSRSIGYLQQLV
jgi:hypothetical protein